jgi:hypothetical protein
MEENEQEQVADFHDHDTPLASWQIHAFPHYERGALWYILTGIIGGVLLVTAFLTNNFLLAAIVVMVGVVLLIQGTAKPPVIDVRVEPLGIRRGTAFISYPSISRFWIVYDPPIKGLYLTVPRSLFTTIHIPIDDQDPVELRDMLKKYIHEDMEKDHEPISDAFSRIFKI